MAINFVTRQVTVEFPMNLIYHVTGKQRPLPNINVIPLCQNDTIISDKSAKYRVTLRNVCGNIPILFKVVYEVLCYIIPVSTLVQV